MFVVRYTKCRDFVMYIDNAKRGIIKKAAKLDLVTLLERI